MGRHKKVIPTFDLELIVKAQTPRKLLISQLGNLVTSPVPVPGTAEDFQKALLTWISEYRKGPKRVRKPVAKRLPVASKN